MSSCLVDSDDSDDEFLKTKRNKGRRGRRGFSKKSATDEKNALPKVVSAHSTIYSSQVSKCFSNLRATNIAVGNENNNSDVEDDLVSRCPTWKNGSLLPPNDPVVLSDDEDTENCQNAQNMPARQEMCTLVSPSPPPPPPPVDTTIIATGRRGRHGRQTKHRKSLYTAVDNFTKNLSAVQHQLLDDSGGNTTLNADTDVSVVEDDVTVRIDYLGTIRRFTIQPTDHFSSIITQMSTLEDVCERAIMLVHGDKTIRPTDTPESITLHTADIIKCHIKEASDELSNSLNDSASTDSPDAIELCLQNRESRQRYIIKGYRTKPLSIVMRDYAVRVEKDVYDLQFLFDGEPLQPSDTPESQDMDDGDIIDVTSANHAGSKRGNYDYSLVVID